MLTAAVAILVQISLLKFNILDEINKYIGMFISVIKLLQKIMYA